MNEFDHFMKQKIKVKYYIRYADDFVILNNDKEYLLSTLKQIQIFLKERLLLNLHPQKVHIATVASGIDFLGWVHFPYNRVIRTSTKKRIQKAIKTGLNNQSKASYIGLLKWGNAHRLSKKLGF